MVAQGVPARQPHLHVRWATKPHASAVEHLEEALQKAWKDAHHGRILLCLTKDLPTELMGVLSTPLARSRASSGDPSKDVEPQEITSSTMRRRSKEETCRVFQAQDMPRLLQGMQRLGPP